MRSATSARCGCGARETGLWERDPGAPVGYEATPDGRRVRARRPRPRLCGRQGRRAAALRQELDPAAAAGAASASADLTQIAFAGGQAIVAAGRARRDILVNDGGGWRVDEERARAAALRAGRAAAVRGRGPAGRRRRGRRAATSCSIRDSAGRAVALLRPAAARLDGRSRRRRSGTAAACAPSCRSCARSARPVALSAGRRRRRGRPERSPLPLLPAFPLPPDGFVLRETATGWRDEQHSAFAGSDDDRPLKSDPVLDFARRRRRHRAGRSAAGAASRTRPDSGSSGRGAGEQGGPRARADRGRVPATATQSAAPPGAAQRRRRRCRPGRRASRSAATPPARRACADLALQDIRPDRSLAAALEQGRRAARAAGRPAHDALHGRPAGRRASTPRVATARDGALRVAAGLRSPCPCTRPCRRPTSRPRARSAARSRTSSRRSAAARRRPAWTSSRIPGAPPAPGRPHALRVRLGRRRRERVRVIVIDNSAGSLEASDAAPESARGPGRRGWQARCWTRRRAASPRS